MVIIMVNNNKEIPASCFSCSNLWAGKCPNRPAPIDLSLRPEHLTPCANSREEQTREEAKALFIGHPTPVEVDDAVLAAL